MNRRLLIIGAILFSAIFTSAAGFLLLRSKQGGENIQQRPKKVYTSVEYGFSVSVPDGWGYKTPQEKAGNAILVVELLSLNKEMIIPIFIEKKGWETVISEIRGKVKPETVEETIFAGQPALKIVSRQREINPGYTFRIKHPHREDIVLLGTASLIKRDSLVKDEDLTAFHQMVEAILDSITF